MEIGERCRSASMSHPPFPFLLFSSLPLFLLTARWEHTNRPKQGPRNKEDSSFPSFSSLFSFFSLPFFPPPPMATAMKQRDTTLTGIEVPFLFLFFFFLSPSPFPYFPFVHYPSNKALTEGRVIESTKPRVGLSFFTSFFFPPPPPSFCGVSSQFS